jgi:MerR family copper efflux transcriptional regulator
MEIRELVEKTGVSAKTIRYYEEISLLPPPTRKPNGYRNYSITDVDRLRLVAGARRMDIPIAEIQEILDMRDREEPPCIRLLELIAQKREEIRVNGVDPFPTGQTNYALGCRVYQTPEGYKGWPTEEMVSVKLQPLVIGK